MKKEKAKEYLPLVQAFGDGKTIQFNRSVDEWVDLGSYEIQFDCPPERYRIKPEPREFWIVKFPNNDLSLAYPTAMMAENASNYKNLTEKPTLIHVKEVL